MAEINFRSTVLRTYDGIRVFVPNGTVFTEPLENFTANEVRRSLVVLGIDQNASVPEARRVILDVLATLDGVLDDPEPLVLFTEVGDFANILHVLYWTSPPTRFSEITTRSDVTERLYEALPAAGITFPYPVQTLQLQASSIPALTDLNRAVGGASSSQSAIARGLAMSAVRDDATEAGGRTWGALDHRECAVCLEDDRFDIVQRSNSLLAYRCQHLCFQHTRLPQSDREGSALDRRAALALP